MRVAESFYQRPDVVKIARQLLGKVLCTNIDGMRTTGMIVETEAYSWKERGCHAYASKKTNRNAIMFEKGGHAYVYLCYGMHYLFNVVTNKPSVPEAVLIRAIEPIEGIDVMHLRRGTMKNPYHLTSGPGKLTKALGIDKQLNGQFLLGENVWIEDTGTRLSSRKIVASPRIGIDYAGEDALLPWRFTIQASPWVSK